MRVRFICVLSLILALSGCNSSTTIGGTGATRTYNGTASVGDFLNITINTAASTLTYTNVSNGDTGTVPFTLNSDGSYALNDPSGNLTTAIEVPGYALLIAANKTGPNHDTPALITAVESGPISLSTFANHNYNYMQFRTAAGGLEVGSVSIGSTTGQDTSYWPYGALNSGQNSPFNNSTLDFSQAVESSSGTYLSGPEGGQGGGTDYIFGTSGGFFIVDTPNGSILGLQKAATKDFDPSFAGTYKAMFYQKTGAATGQGNVETGTPSLGSATITITSGGAISVSDSSGTLIAQSTLTPIADASYLYGSSGELQDPCYGLFTFRVTTANSQQDVFVTFVGNSVMFSAFSADLPWSAGSSTYDYLYGVGLK